MDSKTSTQQDLNTSLKSVVSPMEEERSQTLETEAPMLSYPLNQKALMEMTNEAHLATPTMGAVGTRAKDKKPKIDEKQAEELKGLFQ